MEYKIYFLCPKNEFLPDSPWLTKGAVKEIVVIACSEIQARNKASEVAGTEARRGLNPWKNPFWSECNLIPTDKAKVVSRQI